MPGRIRSLLLRLEVRPAGRRARCTRNRSHSIAKGEPRFVVRERGIAAAEKGYCASCATAMLHAARTELDQLEERLSSAG